jgi:hypothetical protein
MNLLNILKSVPQKMKMYKVMAILNTLLWLLHNVQKYQCTRESHPTSKYV